MHTHNDHEAYEACDDSVQTASHRSRSSEWQPTSVDLDICEVDEGRDYRQHFLLPEEHVRCCRVGGCFKAHDQGHAQTT
jgi:hypothetical protein